MLDHNVEASPDAAALPPLVAARRLRRAVEPGGFAAQFPQAAALCSPKLLETGMEWTNGSDGGWGCGWVGQKRVPKNVGI